MKQKQTRSLVQNKASVEKEQAQQRTAFMAAQCLKNALYGMPGATDLERQCMVEFIQAMNRVAKGTTMSEAEIMAWAMVPPEQTTPLAQGGETLQ